MVGGGGVGGARQHVFSLSNSNSAGCFPRKGKRAYSPGSEVGIRCLSKVFLITKRIGVYVDEWS